MRALTAALAAAVLAVGGCSGTRSANDGREGDGVPWASGEPRGTGPSGAGPGADGPGGSEPGGSGPGGDGPGGNGLVELRVLADESLTGAFGAVEQGFEQRHPNVEVVLTYAEGGNLARRIAGGESADVFATDDLFAMRTVTDATTPAEEPVEFGGGRLTVTVLAQAADPTAAASFVDFLWQGDGKRILIEAGLLRP